MSQQIRQAAFYRDQDTINKLKSMVVESCATLENLLHPKPPKPAKKHRIDSDEEPVL